MKTTPMVALVLLAAARVAEAQTTDPAARADDEAARAAAEARAAISAIAVNAQHAHEALVLARMRRRADETRCTNDALSRADVALRGAREDSAAMATHFASGELQAARAALTRIRQRTGWSREAALASVDCSPATSAWIARGPLDATTVTVTVDPNVPRVEP
jgi:hypothetical protein